MPPVRVPYVGHVADIAVPHMQRVITDFDRSHGPVHRLLIAGTTIVSITDPQVGGVPSSVPTPTPTPTTMGDACVPMHVFDVADVCP
jgi:hypothetical protein